MFPILIDLGVHDLPLLGETHLALPTYGVMFALGTVLAWIWFVRRARCLDLPEESVFNLCFYSVLAGLLGAKITLLVVDLRFYLQNPGEILGIIRSAGVLIGGVAAGAVTGIFYCRKKRLDLWLMADAMAAPLALAMAVGRLGCFLAGCCYGVPADGSACAVTFTDPMAHEQTGVPLGIPLVPVQLIQAGSDFMLAGLLTVLWRFRRLAKGQIFWSYVGLYCIGRFIIEFWRGDSSRGLYFGNSLSTSQILAAAAVVASVILFIRLGRRKPAGR